MEPRLKVRIESAQGAVILAIEGDVTLMSAQELVPHFETVHRDDTARALILDLSGVNYVDSSGLATFVEALKKCMARKRPLVLHSVSQAVSNVLEVASLHTLFNIQADRAAALKQAGDAG